MHRILTSGRYHETKREIEEDWTMEEVYEAHDVLDLFDRMDADTAIENWARSQRGAK